MISTFLSLLWNSSGHWLCNELWKSYFFTCDRSVEATEIVTCSN